MSTKDTLVSAQRLSVLAFPASTFTGNTQVVRMVDILLEAQKTYRLPDCLSSLSNEELNAILRLVFSRMSFTDIETHAVDDMGNATIYAKFAVIRQILCA